MKRILTGMLATVLVLTLAGCGESSSPADTATTTTSVTTTKATTTKDTTTTSSATDGGDYETGTTATVTISTRKPIYDTPEEKAYARVCGFFDAMKAGDSKTLYTYLGETEAANEMAAAVTLTDYTLSLKDVSDDNNTFYYSARLYVEKSSIDRIPTGESSWEVWCILDAYGTGVYLCLEGEDMNKQFELGQQVGWTPEKFCVAISTKLHIFDTFDPSKTSHEEILDWSEEWVTLRNNAMSATNRIERVGYETATEDMTNFVEITFNIAGVDFTKSELYDEELGMLYLPGKGGIWYFPTVVSKNQNGNRITVEICYHADFLRLMEAVTMRYEIQIIGEDYRLLSCKKVSGNRELAFDSI